MRGKPTCWAVSEPAGVLAAGFFVGAPAAQANGPASPVRLGIADRHDDGAGELSMGAGLEIRLAVRVQPVLDAGRTRRHHPHLPERLGRRRAHH